ncbi:MAG: asparaginase [Rhodobacteraceae bacterium]|nr:asparaginase [Paracoccaceae bacterium]
MTDAAKLVELIRGDMVESTHRGHVVICDAAGNTLATWGDANAVIYPRSACKMLQALPLIESGAAKAAGLQSRHLALACASHQGAAIHTGLASEWLAGLGLGDDDLRCGPQVPSDKTARALMREKFEPPCQIHNNCSGKHTGFLTLNKHLGGGAEYIDIDHPVQKAVRAAHTEMMGAEPAFWGVDGCSAPNFSCGIGDFARAMAKMANPAQLGKTRAAAAQTLVSAMIEHPLLVAGETRACSELMIAAKGKIAIKTGAEGVFAAILPERGIGVALKIEDGNFRASEAVMAAILVRLGVLDAADPVVQKRLCPPELNRRKIAAARIQVRDEVYKAGTGL